MQALSKGVKFLLILVLTGMLAFGVFWLNETVKAYDYYRARGNGIRESLRLLNELPRVELADLSKHVGQTVRVIGDVYVPAPIKSSFFGQPCHCSLSQVKLRKVTTRMVEETSYGGKYGNKRRKVPKQEISWETLSSEYRESPVLLRDSLASVPVELPGHERYVYFRSQTQSRMDGDKSYEDAYCPTTGHLVLIGQVAKRADKVILTHEKDQTFRIETYDPQQEAKLNQELADAKQTVVSRRNGLALLILTIVALAAFTFWPRRVMGSGLPVSGD